MMLGVLIISSILTREQCAETFEHRAPRSARAYFHYFDPVFLAVGAKRNLDPALLKGFAWCETRLDPCAQSPVGASGLMQFMPRTFDEVRVYADAVHPFDPVSSVEAAGIYIAALWNFFEGDVTAVVAAYNSGVKNVLRARKHGRSIPHIAETEKYVPCVIDARRIFAQAMHRPQTLSFLERISKLIGFSQ